MTDLPDVYLDDEWKSGSARVHRKSSILWRPDMPRYVPATSLATAEAENKRLREALRDRVVQPFFYTTGKCDFTCFLCGQYWVDVTQPNHAPDCLLAEKP